MCVRVSVCGMGVQIYKSKFYDLDYINKPLIKDCA